MILGKLIYKKFWVVVFTILLTFIGTMTQVQAEHQNEKVDGIGINVCNITFSNNSPVEGGIIEIRVTIINNYQMCIKNINLSLYLDRQEISEISEITLNSNESRTFITNWTAKKWNHTIGVLISIKDVSIPKMTFEVGIYVEPKPVGNLNQLIMLFCFIILLMYFVIIIPSLYDSIKSRIKNPKNTKHDSHVNRTYSAKV
jgi:hypothetical protein